MYFIIIIHYKIRKAITLCLTQSVSFNNQECLQHDYSFVVIPSIMKIHILYDRNFWKHFIVSVSYTTVLGPCRERPYRKQIVIFRTVCTCSWFKPRICISIFDPNIGWILLNIFWRKKKYKNMHHQACLCYAWRTRRRWVCNPCFLRWSKISWIFLVDIRG